MDFSETYIDLSSLDEFYDFEEDVVLDNSSGQIIKGDVSKLFENSESRNRVLRLQIEYDCELENCEILKNFPNLDTVAIYGKRMKSLKGLEYLTKLDLLVLDFNRDENFDYSILSTLSLGRFEIDNVTPKAKQEISSGLLAKEIKIVGHDSGDLSYLINTGFESLEIGNGKFKNFEGLEKSRLRKLGFYTCKSLSSINIPEKLSVDFLEFETCNKLNFDNISKAVNCKSLRLSNCKAHFKLSSALSMDNLERVVLNNTGVELDWGNIQFKDSKLKEGYISPISKGDFKRLESYSGKIKWTRY